MHFVTCIGRRKLKLVYEAPRSKKDILTKGTNQK